MTRTTTYRSYVSPSIKTSGLRNRLL
ncbi:unnamed protein product [Timema podura]|uniref:Uncharacterized protein n=1 Tax=Timema podura TaxID=61482 RepID=A0ABN7PM67_TIMPD|nr:unnamed protein product [Timema podura]